MAKQFYNSTSTCIRAIDLIKIANQLFTENMQYVKLSIVDCSNENEDGSVLIDALPSADSNNVTHYPAIQSFTAIDPDMFGFRD